MMNISQAATTTGLTPRMIRHYEKIGLLRGTRRTASGYRLFDEQDIHTLRFIQRARSLGFSIEQIGQLLALWQDRERSSAMVKQLARQHLQELEEKIAGRRPCTPAWRSWPAAVWAMTARTVRFSNGWP